MLFGDGLDCLFLVLGIADCLEALFLAFFIRFVRWIFFMLSGILSSKPGGKIGPDEIDEVGEGFFCLISGANMLVMWTVGIWLALVVGWSGVSSLIGPSEGKPNAECGVWSCELVGDMELSFRGRGGYWQF